jgi:ATP-dependent Clp protease adaptor protein ClpS
VTQQLEFATETTSRTKPQKKSKVRRIPPYNVVLLNDDDHTMDFVVEVLSKVFGYKLERCVQLTLLAHVSGRSVIWTGTKELAELKVEQVTSLHEKQDGTDIGPLGCDIEPAPGS